MKMRKPTIILSSLILLVSVFFLVILFYNLFVKHTSKENNSIAIESNSFANEVNSIAENDAKFIIDYEYNRRKQNIKSNVDITNLNEEFADIWKGKIDFYYQQILNHYRAKEETSMIEKTQLMKDNWDKYYIGQMVYYEETMHSVYTTGSIIPMKLSDYSRILYRNKAIEFYKLCLNLMIEVDSP